MDKAQSAARDALARYKPERFGYHASQWIMLNKTLESPRPNPFRDIIKFARASIAAGREGESDETAQISGCRMAVVHISKDENAPTLEDWTLALEYGPDEDLWEYLRSPGSNFHDRTSGGELRGFTFRFETTGNGDIIARGTCHPAAETPDGSYATDWLTTLAEARFKIDPDSEETRLWALRRMEHQTPLIRGHDDDVTYLVKVHPEDIEILTEAMAEAGLQFHPIWDMLEMGPPDEGDIYLTGGAAEELAKNINSFLKTRKWSPRIRSGAGSWPPIKVHLLLRFGAENFACEGDTLTTFASTEEEWQHLAAAWPHIFE